MINSSLGPWRQPAAGGTPTCGCGAACYVQIPVTHYHVVVRQPPQGWKPCTVAVFNTWELPCCPWSCTAMLSMELGQCSMLILFRRHSCWTKDIHPFLNFDIFWTVRIFWFLISVLSNLVVESWEGNAGVHLGFASVLFRWVKLCSF
jgi:hypothetical protein